MVSLVVESKMSFGREMGDRQLTYSGPEAFRCLRGRRWTPVRRYLLAETDFPFPREAGSFIGYFATRKR